ncbi:MAG TPA: metal ABC transporter permease [Patescibacteria group bacterium]|nr:metal ABC transporter permease [Patescibacteria group bacterium]
MPEIFQYGFMDRAFIAGFIVAILAPLIGLFLVVRRYSLLADTLSHVSLVGVATGLLLGFNPLAGALGASTIAAIGMERLRTNRKIFGESILALFLSGGLALALVLLSLANGLNVSIFSYLFGSIATVTSQDLFVMVVCGVLIAGLMLFLFRRFFLISFDEELAKVNGLPVVYLNILLMVLAAATVALAMQVVGSLLVGALMVIPVLTAIQFGKGFKMTAALGIMISLLAVISGLIISFYLNLPSGASIVVLCLIFFSAGLVLNKKHA